MKPLAAARNTIGNTLALTEDRDLNPSGTSRVLAGVVSIPVLLGLIVAAWVRGNSGPRDILLGFGISAVMAVGYQVFVGATGIVSFGHVAFAGIGAYVAGVLTVPVDLKSTILPHLPAWLAQREVGLIPSLLLAALVAAVVALVTGVVVLRLSGTAGGIATLAILVITNEVLRNAETYTRGTQTFFGVPARADVRGVFGTLCVVVAIAVAFKLSRAGLKARAVRDDPLAAETSGISVVRTRLAPWILSAAITGAGGALWAQQLTAFSPKTFYIGASVPIIVMVVLGGVNSVTGAITGAVVVTLLQEFLRRVEAGSLFGLAVPSVNGVAQLALGVVLIALLSRRTRGLMGGLELEFRRKGTSAYSSGRGPSAHGTAGVQAGVAGQVQVGGH